MAVQIWCLVWLQSLPCALSTASVSDSNRFSELQERVRFENQKVKSRTPKLVMFFGITEMKNRCVKTIKNGNCSFWSSSELKASEDLWLWENQTFVSSDHEKTDGEPMEKRVSVQIFLLHMKQKHHATMRCVILSPGTPAHSYIPYSWREPTRDTWWAALWTRRVGLGEV